MEVRVILRGVGELGAWRGRDLPMIKRVDLNKSMQGRWIGLGQDRAIVMDLLWLARKQPMFPVERWVDVSPLAALRNQMAPKISWAVLFTRAYGIVSRQIPELRQCYGGWLRPAAYQTDSVVVMMSVSRQVDGQERLFFARFLDPDVKSLAALQSDLEWYTREDVGRAFRQQVTFARMPWIWRRPILWWRHRVALRKRAYRMGTGGISVLAREGVLNRLHPTPLTSSLNYGPVDASGRSWVTLQCDHRLIDGMLAAQALNAIANCLNNEVLRELHSLLPGRRAA
ncbi:MAG: hypothetical protein D6753_10825 [Planctomycetota bacterium]|nr:MAG: hypothetical protein D6753_10825 [Planctomycetota bacterium]